MTKNTYINYSNMILIKMLLDLSFFSFKSNISLLFFFCHQFLPSHKKKYNTNFTIHSTRDTSCKLMILSTTDTLSSFIIKPICVLFRDVTISTNFTVYSLFLTSCLDCEKSLSMIEETCTKSFINLQ